jgi:lipoic acid synthetase
VDCDFLSLGQYLRPSIRHAQVCAYIPPEKFRDYKTLALSLGFKHCESGPYVRSSYAASEYLT